MQSLNSGVPKIPALHNMEPTGGQQDNQMHSTALDPAHERNITDKKMALLKLRGPGMEEI